jgi:TRAP-type C4-dicarboxylate transport system permease small subunit
MIDKLLTKIEWGVVCFTFPFASILAFLQVALRWASKYYPDFVNNHTFNIMQWSPELIGYVLITGALFGASLGVRSNTHIGVDIITKKLSATLAKITEVSVLAFTVVFLLYISYQSYFYVMSEKQTGIMPDHLPGGVWIYHSPMVIALLLMAVRFGQKTWDHAKGGVEA